MKGFMIPAVLVLVAVLIFGGCAQPAPAPAKPTAPQAPAPIAIPEHKQVAIDILGSKFGVPGYTAAFVLSDLINKNSPWLRATARESIGDNIAAVEAKPEKKKNSIYVISPTNIVEAILGLPPTFKAAVPTTRAISAFIMVAPTFVTLKKDIKSPAEFVDKKIGAIQTTGSPALLTKAVLKDGVGLPWDKLNLQYLGWLGATEALADGRVDVAYVGISVTDEGKKFVPAMGLVQFLSTVKTDVYWFDFPPDVIKKAREGSKMPVFATQVPAGALGAKQPNAFYSFSDKIGWGADVALDDEVVYEICRVVHENYKGFWPADAALTYLSPTTMAGFMPNESDFHPGAIKFYKDKGIKIGL